MIQVSNHIAIFRLHYNSSLIHNLRAERQENRWYKTTLLVNQVYVKHSSAKVLNLLTHILFFQWFQLLTIQITL